MIEGAGVARLEARALEARRLLTVEPEAAVWTGAEIEDEVEGAIVRLQPPADATDARIEEIKALFELSGAVAVKVIPRQASGSIGRCADDEVTVEPVGLRQAVYEVAEQMATADAEALRLELDSVMDEVGM